MSQFFDDMTFHIFVQDAETGLFGLPDKISNNLSGNEYDCAMEETECWNQVKSQIRDRFPRWDTICGTWHARLIPEFYAEQAKARVLLCQGSFSEAQLEPCGEMEVQFAAAQPNCQALQAQVEAEKSGVRLCDDPTSLEDATCTQFMVGGNSTCECQAGEEMFEIIVNCRRSEECTGCSTYGTPCCSQVSFDTIQKLLAPGERASIYTQTCTEYTIPGRTWEACVQVNLGYDDAGKFDGNISVSAFLSFLRTIPRLARG